MSGPPPAGVTTGVAGALLERHRAALGLGDRVIRAVRVEPLGRGESHVNLRLAAQLAPDATSDPDDRFDAVLRISHRYEGADTLRQEVEALGRAPQGLAPRALALDERADLLARPGLLVEYLPGESPADWSAADWTPARLRAHAAGLARIHARTSPRWGGAGLEPDQPPPMRMSAIFASALGWWRQNHPELLELAPVTRLRPGVEEALAAADPAFEAMPRFVLRHGDACAPNLLVAGSPEAPTVRYVDWEWAGFGDGAMDLAHLFWPVDVPPWQVALPSERLELFLDAYEEARVTLEPGAPPDPTLGERREAWITYIMFFDHLHFRTRLEAGEPYRTALATVEAALAERVG